MKFKPGDRVAVYENGKRYVYTVLDITSDGTLRLDNPDCACGFCFAHPKQCRKLVRKKRRKWSGQWKSLRNPDNSESVVFVPQMPAADLFDLLGKTTDVIEVHRKPAFPRHNPDPGSEA